MTPEQDNKSTEKCLKLKKLSRCIIWAHGVQTNVLPHRKCFLITSKTYYQIGSLETLWRRFSRADLATTVWLRVEASSAVARRSSRDTARTDDFLTSRRSRARSVKLFRSFGFKSDPLPGVDVRMGRTVGRGGVRVRYSV